MAQQWLFPLTIVAITVVAMEIVAAAVHRHVMHGPGWTWHRSHHEPAAGYGLLYAIVHDGLVHRRFRFVKPPKSGYLKRLVQAHRLHHAVRERDGAVSFGFLYAPRLDSLLDRLRTHRSAP